MTEEVRREVIDLSGAALGQPAPGAGRGGGETGPAEKSRFRVGVLSYQGIDAGGRPTAQTHRAHLPTHRAGVTLGLALNPGDAVWPWDSRACWGAGPSSLPTSSGMFAEPLASPGLSSLSIAQLWDALAGRSSSGFQHLLRPSPLLGTHQNHLRPCRKHSCLGPSHPAKW